MSGEYKKSYKGFALWTLLFFLVNVVGAPFLTGMVRKDFSVYATLSLSLFMLDVLAYIIYHTEYIYWYNGMPYDKAVRASSRARKRYAYEHMVKFIYASILWCVYAVLKILLRPGVWADIIVFVVLVVGAALSTIKIRLQED